MRDELPEVLREKIPENQASWTVFVQAIKDVDMGHIREGVRKCKDKAASNAQVKADINLLKQRTANATAGNIVNSPTKAIRNQLASTVITQQPMSHCIWPVMQVRPSGHRSHPCPNNLKWYSNSIALNFVPLDLRKFLLSPFVCKSA